MIATTVPGQHETRAVVERIRSLSDAPYGLNLLLFACSDADVNEVVALRPRVLATAWPKPETDLRSVAKRAHAAGVLWMHQADRVDEAKRAASAGADIIVAQGTEGGGHVGLMATFPLTAWSCARSSTSRSSPPVGSLTARGSRQRSCSARKA